MGLIVSNKKYKAALEEIEKLKKEHMKMKKEIVSKDVEINGLNIELKSKDGNKTNIMVDGIPIIKENKIACFIFFFE